MTPQSNFMILAAITEGHEAALRELLESMNQAPGRVNPANKLIPFAQFETLHFARLVILDDKTLDDICIYGVPAGTYPLYLAFLGDVDGDSDDFLAEATEHAWAGLRKIFSHCEGFTVTTDLFVWMQRHSAPAIANYVNWPGRTVRQIHEEVALREALRGYVRTHEHVLTRSSPRSAVGALQLYVNRETSAGRLALSDDTPTPIGWRIRNTLHLIGLPLLTVLASPLLLLLAPYVILRLRQLETTDAELCGPGDQVHSDALAQLEDHYVTNQFTAMGSLKPGRFRLLSLTVVLTTVDYAARHVAKPGRLGRIRTIHFARWVFLDDRKRMVFFSNYDGTVESYMDDFINKTGFGLNAVFSNGIGYPRTNWLVRDGCANEQAYKNFLRRHTLPTQVWYKAYPGLTATDLERNRLIRDGLKSASRSDQAARDWLALL